MAKIYELPLTRNYVANWGVKEAIREFLQNALDSDSPFSYFYDTTNQTLSITSQFSTLDKTTLLLGATSKAEDNSKIGSFGEGYKIAMLVLTRLNHKVEIFNNDVVWEPEFRVSKQFGAETLHVKERKVKRGEPNVGVTFRIHDIFTEEYHEIRKTCLQMQSPNEYGGFIMTPYGQILTEKPGYVYVGGLLINITPGMKYGYNFDPEQVKLERDRQTVGTWDLLNATCKLWYSVADKHMDTIITMIEDHSYDLRYAEYNAEPIIKEALAKAFKEKFPNSIPVKSKEELDKLLERGFKNVVYVNENHGTLLGYDTELKDRATVQLHQPAPLDSLKEFLDKKLSYWCAEDVAAFDELLVKAAFWSVK